LSGTFAALGYRVLIVDADPQGSVSQGFFGSDATERFAAWTTLAALFDEDCNSVHQADVIRPTSFEGIHVLPSNHLLAAFNQPCPERSRGMQFALRDFLEPMSCFDIILFDCPPNLYQCSWNAMIAAEHVLIPIPPEDFGTQGIRSVHQAIANARTLNPNLRRLGHLITRSDRRMLVHRAYETKLRESYGELVFDTTLPELSAFKVSLSCRQPVQMHDPKSAAASAIRSLADEILRRIEGRHRQKEAA
jgi:chromosome partitioning protein